MSFPDLDEVLVSLKEISEAKTIDPDAPIDDLDVDSLDVLEWLYSIEESSGLKIDESIFDDIGGESTIREIYSLVAEAARSAAATALG